MTCISYVSAIAHHAIRTFPIEWRVNDQPSRRYSRGKAQSLFSVPLVDPVTLERADRIYHSAADGEQREGTVTRVYVSDGVARFHVLWDEPPSRTLTPWRGASRGLATSILNSSNWGVSLERTAASHWTRSRKLLFHFGHLVATPGALDALEQASDNALRYLMRHVTGDWGDLEAEDIIANEEAILHGGRILSAYDIPTGGPLWIITDADRSTTVLLPTEY